MRRRQQDNPPRQPLHQHRHLSVEDATPIQSKRITRRSSTLLIAAIVGIVLFFVVVCCALRSLGIIDVGPTSPLQETLSLLRGAVRDAEKKRRVIAVGDIHGDKDALVRALQLANVVNPDDGGVTWIGGSDIVVQIGDLLNKAEQRDEETLAYMTEIERQARAAGGAVVVTVGDHDLHNAPKLWHEMHPENDPFPSWITAAYEVDRTLFVHGSLSKIILENAGGGSLEAMIRDAGAWLSGTTGENKKPKWIGRGDGPIWSRLYSDKASDEHPHCDDDLFPLLNYLSVDRMVVGHTVRREGISSICNGKVWRIDVGLSKTESRAGNIGASEVLELREGGKVATILSTDVKLKSWKL